MSNDGLDMAHSYYAATSAPTPQHAPLTERLACDLVVVGGGCTGLSAALHAAERGLSVVLLEAGRVGWGASGRNGGQIIPGLRKGAADLVRAFGRERARALFDLALSARDLVLALIARHAIDCDLKTTGHLLGAVRTKDVHALAEEVEALHAVMDYPHAALLSASDARNEVDTPYHGALVDRLGGHLHPLNYTLGLARAAEVAGVRVFEHSAATSVTQTAGRVSVATARGVVDAAHAVLAGDALLTGVDAAMEARIMPVANYIVATEPLTDARALIAHDMAVSDSRFVVNYYRLSADGRLLFGGGERYSRKPPHDIAGFVRPFMERTFPQLRGRAITHAWGGLVSVTSTRLPHVGRSGAVWFAHGYSGLGVILSTLAGKLLTDAICGDTTDFDRFAILAPPAFPGGAALRSPLHVLGMLWYALRDRV